MNQKSIKKFLIKTLDRLNDYRYGNEYKSWLKLQGPPNRSVAGEKEWMEKWGQLGYKPNPIYYRLFSHYISNDINIVPTDICHNVVELILDPFRYHGYYGDKNLFDKVMPREFFPSTILRRIYGFYYDENYTRIIVNDETFRTLLLNLTAKRIIVKPTLITQGGVGVTLYEHIDGVWKDVKTGAVLNLAYLEKHSGENFIIQEAFEQHDFMNFFNSTSVNTIRLAVYKSVIDERCHVTQAIMRIGQNGSVVDNGCAGGMFVGIRKENGTLLHCVCNEQGFTKTIFNGIDFSKEYKIPHWEDIVNFAETVGKYIPNQRLFALDVVLGRDNKPYLIEFNLTGFSPWLFQYTVGPAFGEYTDEIIEYCKTRLDKRERVTYLQ